jgi:hypothetical protein
VNVQVRQLFEEPTIRELAVRVEAQQHMHVMNIDVDDVQRVREEIDRLTDEEVAAMLEKIKSGKL